MTTELEKQFFDTFGIEHEERYYNCKDNLEGKCGIKCPCECCDKSEEVYCYPQISDKQYLELICVYNNFQNDTASFFIPFDYKNIKNNILTFLVKEINKKYKNRYFCNDVDKLKHQVQAIFNSNQ